MHQRRAAIVILGIHIGPMLQQQPGYFLTVAIQHQRSFAGLALIHIATTFNQICSQSGSAEQRGRVQRLACIRRILQRNAAFLQLCHPRLRAIIINQRAQLN